MDYLEKELRKFYIYSDKELGLKEYDYLDKNGHYIDYTGKLYRNDKSYLTFKKFYNKMKPTKDDFDFMKLHFNRDNDYSFVKSPSIRHLLFNDILLENIDKNDPFYSLLNYDKRKIMYELIELFDQYIKRRYLYLYGIWKR